MSSHNNRNLEPRYSRNPLQAKPGDQTIRPQYNPPAPQPLRNFIPQMADGQKGGDYRFQSDPQPPICVPNPAFVQPSIQQPLAHLQNQNAFKTHQRHPSNIRAVGRAIPHQPHYPMMYSGSNTYPPVVYPLMPNMIPHSIFRVPVPDSNVNSFPPELHFNPNSFPLHYSPVRQPQAIPQTLNQYPPKMHPLPVPSTQVVPQPQPQKPRQRRGATIVDPATNQELNIDELASDKSKPTTASTSETPKENVASALPTTSTATSVVKTEEVIVKPQSNVTSSNVSKDKPSTDASAAKSKTVESTSSASSALTSQAKESKPSLLPSTPEVESSSSVSKKASTTLSETSSYSKSKPTTQQQSPVLTTSSVSDSAPETPPTVKSQPEIKTSKDLSSKSASAPITDKSTPINSSPPEAKTATSSPPYGRTLNAPTSNSSPTSSAAQESFVQETSQIEAQPATSQSSVEDQTKTVGNDNSSAVSAQQSTSPKVDSTDRGQVFESNEQELEAAQLPPPKATKDVVSLDDQPDLLRSKPKDSESLADESEPTKRSASAESKPGKILYDANFLKQLRFNQLSVQKPKLPNNLSIVRDHPVDARSTKKAECDETSLFMPNYLQGQSSSRSGRNSMQDGRMSMGHDNKVPRKIISTSLSQDVKLRTVENAWKPLPKKQTHGDLDKTSELINRARSLLNKLTPDNYERILGQIKELELDTKERLEKMLDLIFVKAIEEPAFCLQYAKVCNEMKNFKPKESNDVTFGRLLLTKCQGMFDMDMYASINVKAREEAIKECSDLEKKRQLIEELDEEKRIARKKSLGNIKLIGELNGLNILKEHVMLQCISHLISNGHDDSLECLCTLLRSIGQALDGSEKKIFNEQFTRLAQFAKSNKVSSRIRFMIMDLIELRENKWIPRKGQVSAQPKTIKEIHNDLRKQEQAQAQLAQRRSINDRDSYSKPPQRDFMSIAARKSTHQEASSLLKKMQGDPFSFNEFSLGDKSKFMNFSSGARPQTQSASSGSSANKGSPGLMSSNRYLGSSGSKDRWQRPGAGPSVSIEKSKQPMSDDDFITFGSAKRASPTLKKADPEELKIKLKALVTEPNEPQNVAFRKTLPKLSREDKKVFADIALSHALERVQNQPIIADIYSEIYVKVQTKDMPDLIELIRERLNDSDLRIDYPKLDEYFGTLLAKIFLDAPNDELRTVFTRMLVSESSHSIIIIKNVLQSALSYSNKETISQRWNTANLNWEDFSEDSDTVAKFQNDPQLDYLNSKKSNVSIKQFNDITSKIIEETKGDFEPKAVAEKYKALIPEKDACEILSALLSYFIEKSYEEMAGSKDTQKAIEAFRTHFDKYCMLLVKLKKPEWVETDKFLIKAVTEFNIQKERPKDLLFAALDTMYYQYLIDISALEIWYEDKQGNQIDRAVVSKLVESLKSKTDSEN